MSDEKLSEGTPSPATPAPSLREPFVYVLNRLEAAAQADKPFEAGYPAAREAVLMHVRTLAAELESTRSALLAAHQELDEAVECEVRLRSALREAQEALAEVTTQAHGYIAANDAGDHKAFGWLNALDGSLEIHAATINVARAAAGSTTP